MIIGTNARTVKEQLAHYTCRDAPVMLRLLLGIAETSGRPVAIDYLDEPPGAEQPIERRKVVRIADRGQEWLRIADADGTEHTLACWDVVTAILLDGPVEGEAA